MGDCEKQKEIDALRKCLARAEKALEGQKKLSAVLLSIIQEAESQGMLPTTGVTMN